MNGARRRPQRPCDNCRRRRIRCLFGSEAAADCVLCVSRNTQCTYVQSAPSKKRAGPVAEVPVDDNGRQRPSILGRADSDEHYSTSPTTLPTNSLLAQTLGHQNRQTIEVVGSSGNFDISLAKQSGLGLKPPQTLRYADHDTIFVLTPDRPDQIASDFADLDEIEDCIKPYGAQLVALYFRIVHPSFPILHKNVFLEKHGRSYRESTPIGLGAVYVMALNWWSYSYELADLPKPNAEVLETKVQRMLFNAHKRPKISDLQGGLVLMQSPAAATWAITGLLLAMSQNLGADWERGVRKRVAWAMYMQDKWAALIHGRGSHIKDDDFDVPTLSGTDFPETAIDDNDEEGSAAIEQGKQTFMYMVTLTKIVARILDQFFTLKVAKHPLHLQAALEQAKPLQLELKAWYTSIPNSLSVEETVSRKLSSVGYLHLAYYTAEVTLHRAILRACAYSQDRPDLIAVARKAANDRFDAALAFVGRLKGEHLQSFWYFSSSAGLAIIGLLAAILQATALTLEEQEMYRKRLAEYRWALRINAKSTELFSAAITLLDSRTHMLDKSASQKHVTSGSVTSPDTMISPDQQEQTQELDDIADMAMPDQLPNNVTSDTWTEDYYDFNTPYTAEVGWADLAAYAPAQE
ncbi:Transcriptional activator protein DAL81 [Cyphellophora attinorum]|uniref:Transcriptional activator protein DAL81 n=1 Tax=Cyphellophora attinorum TaxID=1664694 RepID=A0A0N0NQE1_9EURO|nr:Transcriptional activator protein DAL81 [Phialophora attinorum]KPI43801.1 Transcriptional activator protein DAL81 [Phialophora attinorum]